jgi:hypothetical protein
MNQPVCLELLVVTILAWAGLWGCVDELIRQIESVYKRVTLYLLLCIVPLLVVTLQNHVSVCSLL